MTRGRDKGPRPSLREREKPECWLRWWQISQAILGRGGTLQQSMLGTESKVILEDRAVWFL